jgi:hypothetical protein
MNLRGFLGGILAACAGPAIVHSTSIMRISEPKIILPQYTLSAPFYLPNASGVLTASMIANAALKMLGIRNLLLISSFE